MGVRVKIILILLRNYEVMQRGKNHYAHTRMKGIQMMKLESELISFYITNHNQKF